MASTVKVEWPKEYNSILKLLQILVDTASHTFVTLTFTYVHKKYTTFKREKARDFKWLWYFYVFYWYFLFVFYKWNWSVKIYRNLLIEYLNYIYLGYGFYTPTSLLSRGLTIAYSIFGIPLFLLYLSVVGERLGRVITSCCSSKSTIRQSQRGNNHNDDGQVGFHYHDVNMVLQPINHQNCNGNSHNLVVEDSNEDVLMDSIESHQDTSR